MCTNYVLTGKKGLPDFARALDINEGDLIMGSHFGPGAKISIVTATTGVATVVPAIWWLYLQQTAAGLKPHKDYFSVNTNYRKLPQKTEFRSNRCIVPASAIIESQDGKRPHLLEPADDSIFAFGGLWKEWTDKVTGEVVRSASIITLPGHPALANIHRKSIPLWLPMQRLDAWLDPKQTNTHVFDDLLQPAIRTPLKATPIDRVGTKNPIGDSFVIEP
jgi:putative SOS response-associated peptidase YedK